MPLTTGTRFGQYEILGPLGAGGMGEVYRAHDTKLNRDVAVKVLPEAVANDRERLARFAREAQALAALNHPNIATIYGVEDGATQAIVMELVDGLTLGELMSGARAGLPLDQALAIARQIADALEAAHGRGIVHRDLKPANVKITPDGAVKVLDMANTRFGMRAMLGRKLHRPWGDLFNRAAGRPAAEAYPELSVIRGAWAEVGAVLMTRFEQLIDTELGAAAPLSLPTPDRSVRGAIAFFAHHEGCHLGQMAYIRKWLGFPGLVDGWSRHRDTFSGNFGECASVVDVTLAGVEARAHVVDG